MRILIAAVLGGIVMFTWSAFSHMVLGLGEEGSLPPQSEAAVVAALKTNVSAPGLYFIPGMDMSRTPTEEEQAAWAAKYKEGPNAILIYHPDGAEAMTPSQLGTELGSNILVGLLVATVLALAQVSFARGLIIATLIGLAGWTAIEVSYWNWFRFPVNFVRSELIDQAAGFFLMGLVAAFVMRKRS